MCTGVMRVREDCESGLVADFIAALDRYAPDSSMVWSSRVLDPRAVLRVRCLLEVTQFEPATAATRESFEAWWSEAEKLMGSYYEDP
ncbi:MAG: hypothetical protein PVJ57_01075 [Phycisphaerae bacterium]|jgi:hypothetical protein